MARSDPFALEVTVPASGRRLAVSFDREDVAVVVTRLAARARRLARRAIWPAEAAAHDADAERLEKLLAIVTHPDEPARWLTRLAGMRERNASGPSPEPPPTPKSTATHEATQ